MYFHCHGLVIVGTTRFSPYLTLTSIRLNILSVEYLQALTNMCPQFSIQSWNAKGNMSTPLHQYLEKMYMSYTGANVLHCIRAENRAIFSCVTRGAHMIIYLTEIYLQKKTKNNKNFSCEMNYSWSVISNLGLVTLTKGQNLNW